MVGSQPEQRWNLGMKTGDAFVGTELAGRLGLPPACRISGPPITAEAGPDLHLQRPTQAASVFLFLLFLRGYFSAEHIPSCCHGSRDRGYIP